MNPTKGVFLMAEKIETKEKKAPKEKKVGEIAHYFGKIMVAAIKVKAEIKVGDTLHIKGHTTDFEQVVDSIQIEHESIPKAKKGDDIGIKVKDHVREGDEVFLK
jgi:putative protease